MPCANFEEISIFSQILFSMVSEPMPRISSSSQPGVSRDTAATGDRYSQVIACNVRAVVAGAVTDRWADATLSRSHWAFGPASGTSLPNQGQGAGLIIHGPSHTRSLDKTEVRTARRPRRCGRQRHTYQKTSPHLRVFSRVEQVMPRAPARRVNGEAYPPQYHSL